MKFRRIGTELIYDVTNPELLPLYKGNEAYEAIEEAEKPAVKKTATKKAVTK